MNSRGTTTVQGSLYGIQGCQELPINLCIIFGQYILFDQAELYGLFVLFKICSDHNLYVIYIYYCCFWLFVLFYVINNVWVHVVNGRVFARSNKYTFKDGIHDSTNFIFGICYMELVMDSI